MLALWTRGKTYTVGLDTELNKKLIAFLRSVNPRTRQLIQHTYEIDVCSLYVILCSIQEYLCMIFLKFSLFVFHKNIKKIKIIIYDG